MALTASARARDGNTISLTNLEQSRHTWERVVSQLCREGLVDPAFLYAIQEPEEVLGFPG